MKIQTPPDRLLRSLSALLLASAAFLSGHAAAQVDEASTLEPIRVSKNLPGLSVIVIKKGHIIAQGATGLRSTNNTLAALKVDDRINFGSCTKFVTATVAARLVDKGKISWTSRIRDVFPSTAGFNSAFLDVTLDDILGHRSGIQQQNTFSANHWNDFQSVTGSIPTLRAWVANRVLSDAPEVSRGTFLYANQGYTVAAEMLELASGKSWEQLVQDEVFAPLRMTTATFGISYDNSNPPNFPVGHDLPNGVTKAVPQVLPSTAVLQHYQASNGAGGYVLCTLADYAKFLHAHVAGETGTGYLSTASRAHIITPYAGAGANGYAEGTYAIPQTWATPGLALTHSGDIFGEDTDFWAAPGTDFAIVIYTNARSTDSRTDDAMNAVALAMINAFSSTTVTSASGPLLEAPGIASVAKSGTAVTVLGKTLPAVSYQLQRSTNFTTWTDIGSATTAIDWTTSFTTTSSLTKEFFRMKAIP